MNYELAFQAKYELNQILNYLIRNRGDDAAFELEGDLIEAFGRLALNPGLGHRRHDLTSEPDYFYPVNPYLIVYDPYADPVLILGIYHSARNLRKILKARRRKE